MLTKEDIYKFLHSNDQSSLLTQMISLKTAIQSKVAELFTPIESLEIVFNNGKIDHSTIIDKLILVASSYYKQNPNKENLFCLSMVVGTIIKEYDFTVFYLTNEGLYILADRISQS